jgi:hypothetical protein
MEDSKRPEKPGEDASAAEIARWLEADFEVAASEGMIEALENKDDE